MRERDRPLIEVKGLSHTYLPGTALEARSLCGIDLEVFEGQTVGIIGPSGSGKSTLLYHLNGLLRPQEGEVIFDGASLSDPEADVREIRIRVGLVFQNPENQLFERYAGDDIAYGPRNLCLSRQEVRERVRRAMDMVGLPFRYKDRLVSDFSTGEKRRIAIAGVLAMEPDVLVLDEPAASLDPEGRGELFHTIGQWRRKRGRAVVVVSHNMEDIVLLSDQIYVLAGGRVVLQGTAREVFSHSEILVENGLAVPGPARLIQRLSDYGFNVRTGAVTIEEAAGVIEELFNG